jgi:DNA modification methylase
MDEWKNKIIEGDCLEVMKDIPDNSIDAVITDPPYGLSFMGKKWDYDIPSVEIWCECLRVLKPGGYLLSFAGTRTQHRMACNIEYAGFEIRDMIAWVYGCVPEETKILTKKGWKEYTSLKKGEHIFSFNPITNKIESDEVKEVYEYRYKGEMIKLKNDNTEQLLTPNHRIYCKEEFREQKNYDRKWYCPDNWSWKYAEQIKNYGKYNLPLGAVYDGYLSIGIDFSSLLGWILSEGNFQGNAINIYQSSVNYNKVLIIKNILDKLKIKYSHYKRKRKYKEKDYIEHQFYFSGDIVKQIKEWIPNKKPTFNLLNLKYEEKIALFNSLLLGDGSRGYTFYQNDLKFLEWFQTLCHLIGKQARINKKKMCVEVLNNPNTQLQARHLKNRKEKYDGIVWCPQTKNGTWIAKYKGRIFITGNSGFPKSHNIGVAVDKLQGNKRDVVGVSKNGAGASPQKLLNHKVGDTGIGMLDGSGKTFDLTKGTSEWEGWGTSLKPALEPVTVARKPLSEKTVAENVLKWGTGGINIDGCRVGTEGGTAKGTFPNEDSKEIYGDGLNGNCEKKDIGAGRFPANLIHSGEDEVLELFPNTKSVVSKRGNGIGKGYHGSNAEYNTIRGFEDSGSAARFFYCAKASKKERDMGCEKMVARRYADKGRNKIDGVGGDNPSNRTNIPKKNFHPTVKPINLMEYLIKLVSRKNAIILDPFAGSGTTGIACKILNRNYILIEKESEYIKIIKKRLNATHKIQETHQRISLSIDELW